MLSVGSIFWGHMAQAALSNIDVATQRPTLGVIVGGRDARTRRLSSAMTLGLILALTQVLDGVLTAIGMTNFGIEAEGNILLRTMMSAWGFIPALVIAKSAAVAVVFSLVVMARSVHWVPTALKGLIAAYVLAAIIPWTMILLNLGA